MKFLTPRFVWEIAHGITNGAGSASPIKRAKSPAVGQFWKTVGEIACCGSSTDRGQPLAVSTYGWSTPLRVFIWYANPVVVSFGATLHKQVVTTLRSGGHETNDCDLYAESYNPVMGEQERVQYHNVELNRVPIAAYADRLPAAEALVLVYPVWNEGFPAILKGFFDRVFIPGVSFKIGPDGAAIPNLRKLRKLAAVALMAPVARPVSCLGTRPSAS